MEKVKDLKWEPGITVHEMMDRIAKTGFQGVELGRAVDIIVKMKKNDAKTIFTFTSNMVTSGLRGFFAQVTKLKIPDIIVTTVGGVEEDIMRSIGEDFLISSFHADDVELHEKGMNRVGNLLIPTEAYCRFEDTIGKMLKEIYAKKKRISVAELLKEIGLMLDDEDSFLYQAAKNDIPVFCPAITDGSLGFHLYLFQEKYNDFVIDIIDDFRELLCNLSYDDVKGIIALGGGVSKHHAILATLLSGGADYAVYISTARAVSGSMSGATTNEAKSWGKIKDDADAITVNGDVTILFPIAMMAALDKLKKQGLI